MIAINKKLCHYDKETRTATIDASEAGLPPGRWPEVVMVLDEKNEGFLFLKSNVDRSAGGDIMGVHYHTTTASNLHLLIFND